MIKCQQRMLLHYPVILVVLSQLANVARAADYSAYIQLATEYDTNVYDNQDKTSDSKNSGQIGLALAEQYNSVQVNLGYILTGYTYANQSFADESNLTGTGTLDWQIIAQNLNWVVEHEQRLTTVNAQAPDTPDNQDERTIMSTGPRLNLNFSDRDRVSLSALYTAVNFEEGENDSERVSIDGSYAHLLNVRNTTTLAVSHSEIDYTHAPDTGYSFDNIKLIHGYLLKDGSAEVSVGLDDVESDTGANFSGNSYGLSFSKNIGGNALTLSFSKTVSDSTISLLNGSDVVLGESNLNTLIENTGTTSIIKVEQASLSWARALWSERTQMIFGLMFKNEENVSTTTLEVPGISTDTGQNQEGDSENADEPGGSDTVSITIEEGSETKQLAANLGITRSVTDKFSVTMQFGYDNTRFETRTDYENHYRLGVKYDATEDLGFTGFVRYANKRSSDKAVETESAQVGISARYDL